MKIESINLSEISPYDNNAKKHPRYQIQQIKESIQSFGNNDPIAIDENGTLSCHTSESSAGRRISI